MGCGRCWRPRRGILFLAWDVIFWGYDLPVNALREDPSDCDAGGLRGCNRLDGLYAGDLGFRLWVLCVEFCRFGVAILRVLLFGHFMAGKLPKNGGHIGFLAIKWPRGGIFGIAASGLWDSIRRACGWDFRLLARRLSR